MADITIISVPSQSLNQQTDGLYTGAEIKSLFGDQITGLSTMAVTSTDVTTAEGTTRTLQFTPQSGNKG